MRKDTVITLKRKIGTLTVDKVAETIYNAAPLVIYYPYGIAGLAVG